MLPIKPKQKEETRNYSLPVLSKNENHVTDPNRTADSYREIKGVFPAQKSPSFINDKKQFSYFCEK